MEKLIHYLYECVQEGVIPNIHSEDLMNLEFLKPFVKRLVEQGKIDFSREGEYCTKIIEEFDGLLRDDEDGLIMILAISSSPIDDLTSYLK